jgi:hypothetical protein
LTHAIQRRRPHQAIARTVGCNINKMNKDRIYDLLYQKSEILQKRLNRLFLFIYLFPLVYFLLDNSFISTVNTPLISINQAEIILLTFPIAYSSLLLLILVVGGRLSDIQDELFEFEKDNPSFTTKIKKLLQPVVFISELADKKYNKGLIGCLGQLFVYTPIILFTLLFPILFLGYIIYDNFNYCGDYKRLAIWSSILGIWIILVMIIQIIALVKKSKKK